MWLPGMSCITLKVIQNENHSRLHSECFEFYTVSVDEHNKGKFIFFMFLNVICVHLHLFVKLTMHGIHTEYREYWSNCLNQTEYICVVAWEITLPVGISPFSFTGSSENYSLS